MDQTPQSRWNDGHRFSDRTAVVTGAGGTLGGAIAQALGREGAHVALGYRSSDVTAQAVAKTIMDGGGEAVCSQLDVTDLHRSVLSFRPSRNVGVKSTFS